MFENEVKRIENEMTKKNLRNYKRKQTLEKKTNKFVLLPSITKIERKTNKT